MINTGRIKHVFPGGNTPKGFFSYYDYILSQEDATRIICIKGGPGVGKSTFMKSIGTEMVNKGYDVEYMHCSSDNNSLDGVVIKDIKVALLDGTAPHVVDPKNPGAVDEILHLGDYWEEDGLRKHKNEILTTNATVGKLFKRAYRYLAAAKCIYDDIAVIYQGAADISHASIEVEKIIAKELALFPISNKRGKVRKLFASAITPNGLCNYLGSVIGSSADTYVVKGSVGSGTDIFLAKIMEAVVERGFDLEGYYCPMEPETKIEHLVVPELNLKFTTSNKYHKVDLEKVNNYKIIDFDQYLNYDVISKNTAALQYNEEMFNTLINKTVETISEAKKAHDIMEKYYIPNMNFDKVQQCLDVTMERLLKY